MADEGSTFTPAASALARRSAERTGHGGKLSHALISLPQDRSRHTLARCCMRGHHRSVPAMRTKLPLQSRRPSASAAAAAASPTVPLRGCRRDVGIMSRPP